MMEKKAKEEAPEAGCGEPGGRLRRYSAEENLRMLSEAEWPGSSVSVVARKYGVNPSQLFRWRQLKEAGSVSGLTAYLVGAAYNLVRMAGLTAA
ncbi:transposase [Corallococcus sp. M34]|uniref:transposase n=1 Tax=Citreicoccus inhibens TaxID=2849499 RepID=UPI001C227DFB|nr:transposase [Citreicoccus inhibens]MBU8901074.1 transposase [Citreicoccus inhibens]